MNKGFITIDSLISVFIVCAVASLSLICYEQLENYYDGYEIYKQRIDDRYKTVYANLDICEVCEIEPEEEVNDCLEQY